EIFDRVIGAVMPLSHLYRPCTERKRQHLMPQADAEDRQVGLHQITDYRHSIFPGCRRVAGTVGKKNAVGIKRHDLAGCRARWNHCHVAALGCELAQDVALDAIVDGYNMKLRPLQAAIACPPTPRRLVANRALSRRDGGHEIHSDDAGPFPRFSLKASKIKAA